MLRKQWKVKTLLTLINLPETIIIYLRNIRIAIRQSC